MKVKTPRLMFAGGSSGSGKTTLTCAFLAALKNRGLTPAAFKCGPDYIDPMFHTMALGISSRNLDIFMCGEESVKYLLTENGLGKDISVIEGVMGLYDGLGQSQHCSSNHLAMLTGSPTVLVVSGSGQSLSLAAQLFGYLKFRPNTVKGVVFNQTSEKMYQFYKKMLEDELGLASYGYLPKMPDAGIKSRHLGLVTPAEICDIQNRLGKLGRAAEGGLDIDGLLGLARSAGSLHYPNINIRGEAEVSVAVAYDKAFCFYYEDNFDLLRRMGAKLEFFSPLRDSYLPQNVDGLILGGGYPEEHAAALAANATLLKNIKTAVRCGLPVFAECGGFMYLCRSLSDRQGASHPMLGLIDADTWMTTSLKRFGYVTLTAEADTAFCRCGDSFNAHEFHYSDSSDNGAAFRAVKANGLDWRCIHNQGRIFAGYPHVHFWGAPELARSFVGECAAYKREKGL